MRTKPITRATVRAIEKLKREIQFDYESPLTTGHDWSNFSVHAHDAENTLENFASMEGTRDLRARGNPKDVTISTTSGGKEDVATYAAQMLLDGMSRERIRTAWLDKNSAGEYLTMWQKLGAEKIESPNGTQYRILLAPEGPEIGVPGRGGSRPGAGRPTNAESVRSAAGAGKSYYQATQEKYIDKNAHPLIILLNNIADGEGASTGSTLKTVYRRLMPNREAYILSRIPKDKQPMSINPDTVNGALATLEQMAKRYGQDPAIFKLSAPIYSTLKQIAAVQASDPKFYREQWKILKHSATLSSADRELFIDSLEDKKDQT